MPVFHFDLCLCLFTDHCKKLAVEHKSVEWSLSMANTKAEITHQHLLQVASEEASLEEKDAKPRHKNLRIASIDIFRGFTVALAESVALASLRLVLSWEAFVLTITLMILVDDAGDEWPMIGHAPWNGCHLADFVMPFFLFIVGMAIALALKKIPNHQLAIRKVVLRTLKLLFFGLLLQGGFSHAPDELTYGVDMQRIRWCGILQRITLGYLVVALIEILMRSAKIKEDLSTSHFLIFKSYFWHWLLGACFLIIYLAVLYGAYVPDWHFTVDDPNSADYGKLFSVSCNVRGELDPPCNAVGYVDREVMGINHMYQKPAWKRSKSCTMNSPYEGPLLDDAPSWCLAHFEPEGILSSISAVLSTVIGVHFGHVLVHIKDHSTRLKHWVLMGLSLLLLGIILHFTNAMPLNKQLYSFSYVCLTSGAAALTFSTFYILVDILKLKYVFLPFEWIGMNAMLVYVMAAEGIFAGFINGWYYKSPHNTLIYWIQKHIFYGVWHSRRVGLLLYVIFAEILFWAVVSGILHWRGIYWRL